MLTQILLDYRTLPDPRTLTFKQVVYFYDGLRQILRDRTKPKSP